MIKLSMADLLSLSVSERIRLAQALWDSIAAAPETFALTEREKEELDRRLEAYYGDPKAGSPWPDVMKKLRQRG